MSASPPRNPEEYARWMREQIALYDVFKPLGSPLERWQSFLAAMYVWRLYPQFQHLIVSAAVVIPLDEDLKDVLRLEFDGLHERAAAFLTMEARRFGLHDTAFLHAAETCRMLFSMLEVSQPGPFGVKWFQHPATRQFTWPWCLGAWLFELPPKMQEVILTAEESLSRLGHLHDLEKGLPVGAGPDAKDPPAPTAPVSLDRPQITIGGTAYALTLEQAVYIQTLIEHGDWMTDAEFKAKHPEFGENARPDRWRNKLPNVVKERLETDRRKGTRWRKA